MSSKTIEILSKAAKNEDVKQHNKFKIDKFG